MLCQKPTDFLGDIIQTSQTLTSVSIFWPLVFESVFEKLHGYVADKLNGLGGWCSVWLGVWTSCGVTEMLNLWSIQAGHGHGQTAQASTHSYRTVFQTLRDTSLPFQSYHSQLWMSTLQQYQHRVIPLVGANHWLLWSVDQRNHTGLTRLWILHYITPSLTALHSAHLITNS